VPSCCPRCRHAAEPGALFCSRCGARIGAPPPSAEIRKTVTVLFTDIAGSTHLGETLDAELVRRILGRWFDVVSRVLEKHGGTVEKFIGDAVMAVFGIPVASEDDALRAARAAVEARDALAEIDYPLEARTGINTGEVVAGDPSAGQALVTGDAVNVAARLEQAAGPGEILVGPGTERLLRPATRLEALLPLALKGKAEPVPAWRLLEVFDGAPALERRLDTPLVGRELELLQLRHAFQRTVQERSCCLFTVLGPAGVGKSRLAKEFVDAIGGDAMTVTGRCLPYGEGITFWPVAEIVHQLTGGDARGGIEKLLVGEDDAALVDARISEAIGASETSAGTAETFWAVRRLLETLARERPLVVVVEDLHWAEQTFLELVDDLADRIREAPVVLVCLARPELLDLRPGWGGGKLNAITSLLAPLDAEQSVELIESLVGEFELHSADAAHARERIVDAAGGNPLFIEQMLAMVNEGWFEGNGVTVPPTIQAVLTARLDALDPEERELLTRAALIGREFWRGALVELLPEEARGDVDRKLDRLMRRQLLGPAQSTLPHEPEYRFRHLLLRDAAYNALPRSLRSELHERFAAWLERAAVAHAGEYGVIVGYHLERAYHERVELGRADAHARRLAAAAATRLGAAGRSAFARDDVHAAAGLLDRATRLLPDELELALDLSACLFDLGETTRCVELLERAAGAGDSRLAARAVVQRRLVELRVERRNVGDALRTGARAAMLLARLGDARGVALAHELRAEAHAVAGRFAAAERALARALDATTDAREGQRLRAALCRLALDGPEHRRDALARCMRIGASIRGNRRAATLAMLASAGLYALGGETEEARALGAAARVGIAELNLPRLLASASQLLGTIELVAGDGVAAERELRRGYDFFGRAAELGNLCGSAGLLARALLLQGRLREADALAREVEAAAAPEDAASQIAWRSVRARVLAARGERGEAERLAREAVARAARTDDLHTRARALLDLAAVRGGDAQAEHEAELLLARKGVRR
jgi:class 3 adenylate cyclase